MQNNFKKQQNVKNDKHVLVRKQIHAYKTIPFYEDIVNNFLIATYREIKEHYPDLQFSIRWRKKSERSLENKLRKKEASLDPNEDPMVYDYFAARIIIEEIPKDYISDNTSLQETIKKRNQKKTTLDALKQQYDTILKNHSSKKEHSLFANFCSSLRKEIEKKEEQYFLLDDACQRMIAKDVLDFLTTNSKTSSCFGAAFSRRKFHNKDNGYIAEHITINIDDLFFELQVKSSFRDEISRHGSAAHTSREDKQRILPPLPKLPITEEAKKYFFYSVPQYTLIDNGKIQCGNIENFFYYYADYFNLTSDDRYTYITDDNHQIEKVHKPEQEIEQIKKQKKDLFMKYLNHPIFDTNIIHDRQEKVK